MEYCWLSSYFMLTEVQVGIVQFVITNEKFQFSLICSFYCLVKNS